MGIDQPEASSTPTAVPLVRGRRGLRDESTIESPIKHLEMENCSPSRQEAKSLSPSPQPTRFRKTALPYDNISDTDNESDPDLSDKDFLPISSNSGCFNQPNLLQPQPNSSCTKMRPPEKDTNKYVISIFGIIIIVIMLLYIWMNFKVNPEPNNTNLVELINPFKHMERQFSNQGQDFWRSIRINIEEIRKNDMPSTIIFLYENSRKGESTMQRILNNVKGAAVCYLTDCGKDPIAIQGSALNLVEIIADYGKVISQYRDPLETSGVMIVEHLEAVPGKVAQAFHHFCDEYNPLVSNALLLFTVKVDKLPNDEESDSYLKKTLTLLWNDIGRDDKFEPLYARISGTILVVRPE